MRVVSLVEPAMTAKIIHPAPMYDATPTDRDSNRCMVQIGIGGGGKQWKSTIIIGFGSQSFEL